MLFGGKLLLLALLATSALAMMPPSATAYYAQSLVDPKAAFLQWAKDNGKTYSSDLEESYRFLVWRNTLNDVISWNTDMQAETGYFKGLTYFADQTQEEFESVLCSAAALNATESSPEFLKSAIPLGDGPQDGNHTAPSSFDWRAAGVVGSVRNQQSCGGCWAFGPIAAVESALAIKDNISGPPDLSEQEIIDCAPGSNENGCDGNSELNAYFSIYARGVGLEKDYPFVSGDGSDQECRTRSSDLPFVTIDGAAYADSVSDDKTILELVLKQPVTALVEASRWSAYRGGIYDGPCNSDEFSLNHVVTIVGYGEEAGVPFWLIRNSWGETWGEDGYMRLRRDVDGKNGRCGVNNRISFPLYCGWNTACVGGNPTQVQPGLPLGNATDEKAESSSGQVALVEYGEFEDGIVAAFDKEYGAYMQL